MSRMTDGTTPLHGKWALGITNGGLAAMTIQVADRVILLLALILCISCCDGRIS